MDLEVRLRLMRRSLFGWGRGVVVVGMHRSGTSAVSRLVNLLGLPLGDSRDLIEADPLSNPSGHWESSRLVAVNDRLLGLLGGAWSAPPALESGWQRLPAVTRFRGEARWAFAATYSSGDWTWKDPRVCLTLPFWRATLSGRLTAILVVRHPLEIARSMEARNRFPVAYTLALWERYLRQALAGLEGMPVLATTYEGLLADPFEWCSVATSFLREQGIIAREPDPDLVRSFLDRDLRHAVLERHDLVRHPEASEAQVTLYDELLGLVGRHRLFPQLRLSPESARTEQLLAAHRRNVVEAKNALLVPA